MRKITEFFNLYADLSELRGNKMDGKEDKKITILDRDRQEVLHVEFTESEFITKAEGAFMVNCPKRYDGVHCSFYFKINNCVTFCHQGCPYVEKFKKDLKKTFFER